MARQNELEKPEVKYKVRAVPYEGEVGAGRLYPFVPAGGFVEVSVPSDIPDSEPLGTMKINGNSLEKVGINPGDIITVRKVFHRKMIRKHTVCVLWIHSLGELVAKKVTFEKGFLVLHYCGFDDVEPMRLPVEDVEIRGIVIGSGRNQTEWLPVNEDPPVKKIKKADQGKVIEAIERFRKAAEPKPEEPEPF